MRAFSDLARKVCLITGSSRGIGAAVAAGLGAAEMRVAVHYRTGRAEAEQVRAEILAADSEAIVLHGDIAEAGSVEQLIGQTVAAFGRIDVLISNAADLIERRSVARCARDADAGPDNTC